MIPSPHLLRVVSDAPWEIICPYPRAELNRECMYYTECGHTFDGDFDEAIVTVDDTECRPFPIKNPPWPPHHLWVRRRELIVPTLGCEVRLKAAQGIRVVSGEGLMRWQYAQPDVPPGDWPILSWTRHGDRWRDTMSYLEATLAPFASGEVELFDERALA